MSSTSSPQQWSQKQDFKFSAGPWNLHPGADPFGPAVRSERAAVHTPVYCRVRIRRAEDDDRQLGERLGGAAGAGVGAPAGTHARRRSLGRIGSR